MSAVLNMGADSCNKETFYTTKNQLNGNKETFERFSLIEKFFCWKIKMRELGQSRTRMTHFKRFVDVRLGAPDATVFPTNSKTPENNLCIA